MRICHVPGCGERTTRWGRYCNRHKSTFRRHGAAMQRAVTVTELQPYVKRVKARIAKNANNPVWAEIEANWRAVVGHAEGILASFQSGRAGFRHERLAAVEVLNLAQHVEPREIIETALALYLLDEDHRHRFHSHDAFKVQLVRRVRGLTRTNAGEWKDPSGKVKRAYRETPPRVSATLAGWIIGALKGVGILLARLERQQREDQQRRAEAMAEAVKELQ